ncbi:hypothetical protein Agabi119p4_5266 [Agaricus bisporus var. burnettii]|uniref:C2H2-type domain-containing protein n=1 Tax=Agaricus bisporus var. burnettii TaxID=192524 RepID=A0A8H7F528_AGABI|nr:hypothetical protein Agabi119p4_5266 [Agaricus bisporus var. burnettii]
MSPLTPQATLSKRALSGGSQVNTPISARRPKKKAKESSESQQSCLVCSQPVPEKEGTAHKACTALNVSVLLDGGKIKKLVKRDEKTRKLVCPQCPLDFFSTKELRAHTLMHLTSFSRSIPPPPPPPPPPIHSSEPPTVVPTTSTSATETVSLPSVRSSPVPPNPTILPSDVHPPPSDSLQTPLLNRYGLVVNTVHQILICLSCKGIIDPSDVRRHFLKHHQNQRTPLTLQSELDDERGRLYPHLTHSPVHPSDIVDVIYGLEEPVNNYRLCITCRHCFITKKTFDKHPCEQENNAWTVTSAQRFIANSSSPWFPVHTSKTSPTEQNDRWALFQAQANQKTPDTSQNSYSDEFRVLQQFLRGERWLEQVEGFSHQDLVHISTYSTHDTAYGGLHYHIYLFLSSAQSSLDEPFIRRSIGTRPAEEKESSRVKYHKDVNKATLDNYSRIVAAMICLIHRVILNEDTPYTFFIPADIVEACSELLAAFSPQSEDHGNEMEKDGLDDEEVEEESESSEDDESLPPPIVNPTRHDNQRASLLQPKLQTLLYLLFTQLPTNENRGQFFTPIYHFLLLSSLRQNGQWAAGYTITHTIAAILFTGRLVFAHKTLRLSHELDVDHTKSVKQSIIKRFLV